MAKKKKAATKKTTAKKAVGKKKAAAAPVKSAAAVKREKRTIGIVGLGIMGGAFARNLKKAGWRVVGYDISAARRLAAKDRGTVIVRSAADVAREAPVVLTSLPSPKALHSVANEIAGAKIRPITLVEMSTFALADKQAAMKMLKKAKHTMLDVPVSGTGAQAAAGDIVFYASGDGAAIKKVKPVLEAFGRAAYDVGAFGNGSKMKYIANLLVAINNVASAEALVMGMKAGLPPQAVFDLIKAGAGNSRIFELRGPMMVKDNYDNVTASIEVFDKDINLIGDYAAAIGAKTPLFDTTRPLYVKAMESGLGAKDAAAVCSVLEKMSRVRRNKPVKDKANKPAVTRTKNPASPSP